MKKKLKKVDKEEAVDDLQLAINSIKKEFGDDAVIEGRMNDKIKNIERISSGSYTVDLVTGGGYPVGGIVEIYGMDRVGKTFLGLSCIKAAQEQKGLCVFIDVEHRLNYEWAERIGVKTNDLLVSRPNSAEDALEIEDRFIRSGRIKLIILDSVAGLVSKEELDKEMNEETMMKQSRLMSKALRKFTGLAFKTRTTLIFLNQLRIDKKGYYAVPSPPGGNALRFWASIRLELKCKEYFSNRKGHVVKVTVVKNKTAPPFLSSDFELTYNEPIYLEDEVFYIAKNLEILQRKGKFYYYNGENIGSRAEVRSYLQKHPNILKSMDKEIREII